VKLEFSGKKMKEYLKEKAIELERNSKNKNVRLT
jgi:hypothetical protein